MLALILLRLPHLNHITLPLSNQKNSFRLFRLSFFFITSDKIRHRKKRLRKTFFKCYFVYVHPMSKRNTCIYILKHASRCNSLKCLCIHFTIKFKYLRDQRFFWSFIQNRILSKKIMNSLNSLLAFIKHRQKGCRNKWAANENDDVYSIWI